MDLTNNEIENINERHSILRRDHEKLKNDVETQNKYNADNQESVDKALKKLNEEKNIINSDIDMIRNDIRTNENSRKNQDNIFTNKLEQLKQKQIGRIWYFLNYFFYFFFRTWRDNSSVGVRNKNKCRKN